MVNTCPVTAICRAAGSQVLSLQTLCLNSGVIVWDGDWEYLGGQVSEFLFSINVTQSHFPDK